MINKTGLRHIGKAVAELDKASWSIDDRNTQDGKDFEAAYALLRKGILGRNGVDVSAPHSGRLIKTKGGDT